MPNKTRFLVALPQIKSVFTPGRIYTHEDIKAVFYNNHRDWRLPNYMYLELFLEQLLTYTELNKVDIKFGEQQSKRLYSFGKLDVDSLAVNLYPNAYLSHLSAFNYFTDIKANSTVYVTKEQSKKPIDTQQKRKELLQENIDIAFSKQSKHSNELTYVQDKRLVVLRGKYSNNLGIITIKDFGVRLTNPERTLIDMTVRPFYSKGVQGVLDAYKEFGTNVFGIDVKLLDDYLKRMDFIYPYHQAIGFYLDKSGKYKDAEIDIFRRKARLYDFYLDYGMQETEYSKEWRVYYPKNLKFK